MITIIIIVVGWMEPYDMTGEFLSDRHHFASLYTLYAAAQPPEIING